MKFETQKFFIAVALGTTLIFAGKVWAEDMPAAAEMSAEEKAKNDEMMAKWMEFATPNENHKALEQLVGNWDTSVKTWMPGKETAEESTGTSSVQWILGGRFIQQTFTGTHMGQPFEGIGITGYDNQKKKYQSTWMDNMGTGMMTATMNYDAATKTFSEEGSFSCPMKGGDLNYSAAIKIIDETHHSYEMFTTDEAGTESKMMEIQYTKK